MSYTTGVMIAHNFYKRMLKDIVKNTEMSPDTTAIFYAQSLLRLSQSLMDPKLSKKMEKEMGDQRD